MFLKRQVQRLMERAGYRLCRIEQPHAFPWLDLLDILITDRIRENSEFYFIQIGANDGVEGDPLHPLIARHGLRGLSVEPQPAVFQQLLENRSKYPGLTFENAIIGEIDGAATLYVPADSAKIPDAWKQAASLERAQLRAVLDRHLANSGARESADDMITAVRLPSLTLATLLSKHRIEAVDLLVLDTMGFDFRIIKQIPFESKPPALIHFEHRLLPPEERVACYELLADNGYRFCQVDMDTIAVRTRACASRIAAGKTLMPSLRQYPN